MNSQYDKQFQWIKDAWSYTPAIVDCQDIRDLHFLPSLENWPKNKIFVGIIKDKDIDRKDGRFAHIKRGMDAIYILTHKLNTIFAITIDFSQFNKDDVLCPSLGLTPKSKIVCDICDEFATRIDEGICQDCYTN